MQESHKASVKKNHPLQNLEIWVTNEEGKPLLTYGQTPQGEEEVHVYFAPPTLAEKGEEDGKEGDEQEKGKEEPQPSEEQTPAPDLAEVFDIKELQGENTALEKDEYYARFTREFEEQYPEQTHNATLEEYFPHSKWIENENDLSLGILYNDGGATHVCYAVKGSMDAPPAADAEWAEGYWVTFEETE